MKTATIKSRAFDVSALTARGWVHIGGGKLFHPILRRWRCAPKYNAANDPDIRRAEQLVAELENEVDDLLADGEIPFLIGEVSGERMNAARNVLRKLPRRILARLWTGRRKIELVEDSIIDHPTLGRISGVASYRAAKVAAGAEDFKTTLLHEVGHLLDGLRRWHGISNSVEWIEIWKAEKRAGRVSGFADQNIEPAEYLAESFALYWIGLSTRRELSSRVQRFIRNISL